MANKDAYQKAFNKVVKGFKAQDFRLSHKKGGARLDPDWCRYRGNGGCRCAIGHLIPDRAYSTDFEGKSADWVALRVPGMQDLSPHYLRCLQATHDEAFTPEDLKRNLERFARDFGLTCPEL